MIPAKNISAVTIELNPFIGFKKPRIKDNIKYFQMDFFIKK
ncbi:hypothetical protein JCM19274_3275 [Algibacter lectus]|uniref:Uncharacterized protein n=1 Tax=Algibacter lectus TaxID=221126 RepID=A0A090X510_9FLAO|nr:hypothetical protein JCM19274_3275 [Algibacter lectus]